jgi:hypothetical protein
MNTQNKKKDEIIQSKPSKLVSELRKKNHSLAACNRRELARKHNLSKAIRRAKVAARKLVEEKQKLVLNIKKLSSQLEMRDIATKTQNTHHNQALNRIVKSKTSWKKRAYAAEESRRHMLAKRRGLTGLQRNFKSMSGVAYSNSIRSLSRRLVMSGVAAIQVSKVIRMCAKAFGVTIGKVPSPRSIGRFILEGGVSARIQAGNILANAQGMLERHKSFNVLTKLLRSHDQHGFNFAARCKL